jgi:hypothetical protein
MTPSPVSESRQKGPAGPSGVTTRPGAGQLDFGVKFHRYGYAFPTCVCTLVLASVA